MNGGNTCGVAWNTLFLASATAAGTTVLGTLLALLTERSFKRAKPLVRVLATLPLTWALRPALREIAAPA